MAWPNRFLIETGFVTHRDRTPRSMEPMNPTICARVGRGLPLGHAPLFEPPAAVTRRQKRHGSDLHLANLGPVKTGRSPSPE